MVFMGRLKARMKSRIHSINFDKIKDRITKLGGIFANGSIAQAVVGSVKQYKPDDVPWGEVNK